MSQTLNSYKQKMDETLLELSSKEILYFTALAEKAGSESNLHRFFVPDESRTIDQIVSEEDGPGIFSNLTSRLDLEQKDLLALVLQTFALPTSTVALYSRKSGGIDVIVRGEIGLSVRVRAEQPGKFVLNLAENCYSISGYMRSFMELYELNEVDCSFSSTVLPQAICKYNVLVKDDSYELIESIKNGDDILKSDFSRLSKEEFDDYLNFNKVVKRSVDAQQETV